MTSIIQSIKPEFDKVIQYSQALPREPETKQILERWYQAKQYIIDKWKGELILNCGPQVFSLSQAEKNKMLDGLIEDVEYHWDNPQLATFIEQNRDDFFTNRLSKDCRIGAIKVPKGMKLIKAFKMFETNAAILDEIQTKASMIIQEDKICGTLYLSVHPLDFLSSSENTHKWRSCHALDGDYRAGNISYMLDPNTIVCYLANEDEKVRLPNFPADVPWNSKKWRMLLYMEDDCEALFAGRQYPFFSPTGLDCARRSFLSSMQQSLSWWSPWYNDAIIEFPRGENGIHADEVLYGGRHVSLNGRIYSMEELITDHKDQLHFNDLIYSSFYIPYYCWTRYPKNSKRKLHFSIGNSVPCLHCGTEAIKGEATMLCYDCGAELGEGEDEYYTYCGCCDRRIARALTSYADGLDLELCEECFDDTVVCDRCGYRFYKHMTTYNRDFDLYECDYCQESRREREAFNFG